MSYIKKLDANGREISEAVSGLKRRNVSLVSTLSNFEIDVPAGAYGVILKKSPMEVEIKINDFDPIPMFEGDYFTPIFGGIQKLTVSTSATHASDAVLVFIS